MKSLYCRGLGSLFAVVLLFVMTATGAYGQISSGTIQGSVSDPSGQAIADAAVELLNDGTGVTERTGTTDSSGAFVFASVNPGTFTLRVQKPGFQRLERKGNNLSAGNRLALGDLQMIVGAVTETVSVVAAGDQVATTTSATTALITAKQMDNVTVKGRAISNYLLMLPGISTNGGVAEAGASFQTTPNSNGLPTYATNISIDGFTGSDPAYAMLFVTPVNMDALQEINVAQNNYQAEFGRQGGMNVNAITKSGTRDFHGTAYYYKRHESFNANDFFNNRAGRARNIYRYSNPGVSIGGPVMIPKVMTGMRDKLFFFYNYDSNPNITRTRVISTLPTTAQRNGDFSGISTVIRDPTTTLPFAGNVIPSGRINQQGRNLLNVFAQPNQLNPAVNLGQFNNENQNFASVDRIGHTYRIDFMPTNKDSINFRGTWFQSDSISESANWDFAKTGFKAPQRTWIIGWTRILSPTMVNEFTGGVRRPGEVFYIPTSAGNRFKRSNYGFTFGQSASAARFNVDDILPVVSFGGGGLQNSPITSVNWGSGRFPGLEADILFYLQDNFTVTKGKHTYKAGLYYERMRTTGASGFLANPYGNLNFDVNAANPNDARFPFANALLGNFNTYTETTVRTRPSAVSTDIEWFVQDTWRVNKRLTIDLGLRLWKVTPLFAWSGFSTAFAPELYDRTKVPQLFLPTSNGCGSLGATCALNPLTNALSFPALIGTFVPGTGDPAIGNIADTGKQRPQGFMKHPGFQFQPRLGFAYDPFGKGKTAIRGGFAIMNNPLRVSPGNAGPPIAFNPNYFFGTMLPNGGFFQNTAGSLAPSNVNGFELDKPFPRIYQISLGVQQDVGKGMIADVRYVSTLGKLLASRQNLNTFAPGTRFNPANINPLTGRVFPDQFLVPLQGYSLIDMNGAGNSSNYHSLQAALNKRFSTGWQMGVSYTYSKTMDYGSSGGGSNGLTGVVLPRFADRRTWAYGKTSFDQTHMLSVNWVYEIPSAAKALGATNGMGAALAKGVLDNWQISGVTYLSTGTPANIFATLTDGVDLRGGGDAVYGGIGTAPGNVIKPNLTCNPVIAHDQRGIDRMFNASCFARPGQGTTGNAGNGIVRNPGIVNTDLTLFKRFTLGSEQRNLELRMEAYNAFNDTQFSGMNVTANFNAAGALTNASAFGTATSNRSPRVVQLAVRIRF